MKLVLAHIKSNDVAIFPLRYQKWYRILIFFKVSATKAVDMLNENANSLSDSRWCFCTSRNTAVTMVTHVNKAAPHIKHHTKSKVNISILLIALV